MREILFRGKRIDNGEWVYGDLWNCPYPQNTIRIVSFTKDTGIPGERKVIPETVGQYTGLQDKNGVKIFEGDVLKDSLGWVCLVKWDDSNGRFLGYHKKPRGDTYVCYVGREPAQEIIGNIHDNPEMMEGKK